MTAPGDLLVQQGCGHREGTAGDGLPSLSPALWKPASHPTWSSHLPCHASVCTHACTHLCTHTFTHTHVQTQAQTLCSANLHRLHMVTHKHAHPACTRILHAPSRELHARSCAHILHPLCTLLVHADTHMCTHPLFWGHSAPRYVQVLVHITHTHTDAHIPGNACLHTQPETHNHTRAVFSDPSPPSGTQLQVRSTWTPLQGSRGTSTSQTTHMGTPPCPCRACLCSHRPKTYLGRMCVPQMCKGHV